MLLPVNHNTSVTSGELIGCSKRISQASELAAVNLFFVIHEAMNGCKNLRIH